MLIGMGIVYGFLAMLVLAIGAMSSVVQRFFPEMPSGHVHGAQHGDDSAIAAAISAAVHQYRKKHPRS